MKKILIVDDDPDITELIVNRLKKNNYNAICSNDSENGLRMAIKGKPDLIIMDIMMPKMDGGEVAKHLKENESTKNIPILFLTSLTSSVKNSTVSTTINIHGLLYQSVPKPFDPDQLLSAIKLLLKE